jgi:hypothetical protein
MAAKGLRAESASPAARRKGMLAFPDRADDVIIMLRSELAQSLPKRQSGAGDAQLRFALQRVEQMKKEVMTGRLLPRHLKVRRIRASGHRRMGTRISGRYCSDRVGE